MKLRDNRGLVLGTSVLFKDLQGNKKENSSIGAEGFPGIGFYQLIIEKNNRGSPFTVLIKVMDIT